MTHHGDPEAGDYSDDELTLCVGCGKFIDQCDCEHADLSDEEEETAP